MEINFVGGAYKQPIGSINEQLCVNWYPKYTTEQEGNKKQKALYPTPGLSLFSSLGGTRVRGTLEHKSILYVVVDDILHSVTGTGESTSLGSIGPVVNPRVEMQVNNNNELFIGDDATAFNYDIGAGTLTEITDADFPGVDKSAYMDGFTFVTRNGRVHFSSIGDNDSWVATDVFTPGFRADDTIAVETFFEHILCFGEKTIEIFINDGTTPFSRLGRTSVLYGLAAKDSTQVYHEGVLFLGKSQFGGNAVFLMARDLEVMQISPPSVNAWLNEQEVEDAFGLLEYTKDGHIFYHLSIPGQDKTFTYDILTKEWVERESRKPFNAADGQYLYGIYRANTTAFFKGNQIVGDYYSGDLYKVDDEVYTEDGLHIRRKRRSSIYTEEQKYISVESIEFDVNIGDGLLTGQGSNPKLMLRVSKDNGKTYSQERQLDLGSRGDYLQRVRSYALGMGRNWVIEVTYTDPVPLVINAAYVHGSIGAG